jgi:hypothetical protein
MILARPILAALATWLTPVAWPILIDMITGMVLIDFASAVVSGIVPEWEPRL